MKRSGKLLYYIEKLVRLFISPLQNMCPPAIACAIENIRCLGFGYEVRFFYDKKNEIFGALESETTRFFTDFHRGIWLYGSGLSHRNKSLADSYCVEKLNINPEDVVIDCGANYGDFFYCLGGSISPRNYYAFEPSGDAFRALIVNVEGGSIHRLGLSNTSATQEFFISNRGGDSSLAEPESYTHVEVIHTVTIDKFIENSGIEKCKLLKIEAEGWEPEVLEGCAKFLRNVEYVAIDGGPERGVEKGITFPELNNTLLSSGFHMVGINGMAFRALYRNTKFDAERGCNPVPI